MKDKDTNAVILIIAFMAFLFGFLVAEAIYNERPITEEEYYELQKTQWYE
jgi:hypothetical protein